MADKADKRSAWAPFRIPVFRYLWVATLVSNIGTWMHDIGAGWLMTSLSDSPVMVALVQTATTLPIFLLALPAGTLADIVDRRKHLLVFQLFMALVATALALVALLGLLTPWLLVLLTFAMGLGTAMMMPAWAAIVPELVPRPQLQSAVALNSMGINVARAIGPALAGVIIAKAGSAAVFALNALSFFGVILVLYSWERQSVASDLPAERLLGGIRAGIRYAWHAASLQAAMIRGLLFFLFSSASWALLPLIAKALPNAGPETFGILVASVGAGAVAGALLLPTIKARLSRDALVSAACLLYALCLVALALADSLYLLVPVMAVSGIAWLAVLSTLQVAAQLSLPNWVRSRGLAIYMSAFMGSMAFGSLVWGKLTGTFGLSSALFIAAAGMVLCLPLASRWTLSGDDDLDLTPTMHWPLPPAVDEEHRDKGPVLITIRYQVAPEHQARFLTAIQQLGKLRRRDGAYTWGIYQDTAAPGYFIEVFNDESWLDHLRRHERVGEDVRVLQAAIQACIKAAPEVVHGLAPRSVRWKKRQSKPIDGDSAPPAG